MSVLVFAEHDGAVLKDATHKTVAAALALGGPVDVLVAGANAGPIAALAAAIEGVRKVLLADSQAFSPPIAEALSALIVPLMANYDALLAPATATGKNFIPRVAALLDVSPVSEIIAIPGPKTFQRPIYAGNAIETVESMDAKIIATVRPTAFKAAGTSENAPIENLAIPAFNVATQFVGEELSKSDRPELASAKRVVSGGRAMGSAENFALIEALADRIGAAVGASRAAVDAGYAPNDYQVGQTGKVVAPELYVAIGISGAIQHLAGMKDSRVIVAINKDADAPIFQIADFGLVADLFSAVPELTRSLD